MTPVQPCGGVVLAPGETLVSFCCGGGGYGDPLERDPARVQADVAEGWIGRERARAIYGVVLDDGVAVNDLATTELRAERRQHRTTENAERLNVDRDLSASA